MITGELTAASYDKILKATQVQNLMPWSSPASADLDVRHNYERIEIFIEKHDLLHEK
jgi:hypothetical protein